MKPNQRNEMTASELDGRMVDRGATDIGASYEWSYGRAMLALTNETEGHQATNDVLAASNGIADLFTASEMTCDSETFHRHARIILDLVPMMVWVSLPDGTCEYHNKAHSAYTGMSTAQSHRMGWQSAIHPEDLAHRMEKWRYSLDTGLPSEAEVRVRRKDGVYRWFSLRVEPFKLRSGTVVRWYGVATDIEDRKRAEDNLRRNQAWLSEAQRLAGLGIFSWRVGSEVMTWSEPLYRMFQLEIGTTIDRSIVASRTYSTDRVFMFDTVSIHDELKDVEDEIRLLGSDGSIRYLHYCAYVTKTVSGEAEYIGTVQDVTERRLASEALALARAELAQAARTSSLGILTASIAHEVNQPLAGIITNADVCFRMLSSDPPNVSGAIATAQRTIRDGKRAADVISRLRKLFDQKEINASWWNLCDAAREVVELMQSDVRRSRVLLVTHYAMGLPKINGDRIQLQQVIINLIRNAIDAINTTTDGPRIIVIGVSSSGDSASLSVSDSGVGYDENASIDMFKAFYTTKQNGMGIGLSVSRSIVNAHGGQLWARKNKRRGATFGFFIPFAALTSREIDA